MACVPLAPRLIAVEQSHDLHDTSGAEASFNIAWGKMLDRQPLVCAKTGAEFEPHSVLPSAAILDVSNSNDSSSCVLRNVCSYSYAAVLMSCRSLA